MYRKTLLVLLLLPAFSTAQEPVPFADPLAPRPLAAPIPTGATTATDLLTEAPSVIAQPRIRASLDVGFPVGIRVQFRPLELPLWVEGAFGAYGFWEFTRAGVRFEGRVYEGRRNAWLVRPGVGAVYLPAVKSEIRPGFAGLLNGLFDHQDTWVAMTDVDILWRHRWVGGFHTDCGITLGMGYVLKDSARRDWIHWLPHVGLTFGFQF